MPLTAHELLTQAMGRGGGLPSAQEQLDFLRKAKGGGEDFAKKSLLEESGDIKANEVLNKIKLKKLEERDVTIEELSSMTPAQVGKILDPTSTEHSFFEQVMAINGIDIAGTRDSSTIGNQFLQDIQAAKLHNVQQEAARELELERLGLGGTQGEAPASAQQTLLDEGLATLLQPAGPPVAPGFTVPEDIISEDPELLEKFGFDAVLGQRNVPTQDLGLQPQALDPNAPISDTAANIAAARLKTDLGTQRPPIPPGSSIELEREKQQASLSKLKAEEANIQSQIQSRITSGKNKDELLALKDQQNENLKAQRDQIQANKLLDFVLEGLVAQGLKGEEFGDALFNVLEKFGVKFNKKESQGIASQLKKLLGVDPGEEIAPESIDIPGADARSKATIPGRPLTREEEERLRQSFQ